VLTLAGPGDDDAPLAARALALAVGKQLDLAGHSGVHPRLGALDVVPFVALDGSTGAAAIEHARDFAEWVASALAVPVFLYGDADPDHRTLPDARRDAFTRRAPDEGPSSPHSQLGAIAVGARPVLVAVNCELDRGDITIARSIAHAIRERDGGLLGVRALGFMLASRGHAQVSMNLIALEQTGLQQACEAVRDLARHAAVAISRVELVGLVPAAELARCDQGFLEWSAIRTDQTIEARLDRAG
jgi:glutamate formiminotransferase / 5-formyltetrahydrofolate cyclo-ligase